MLFFTTVENGNEIRRKSRARENEARIITGAMLDFKNSKLSIKEFLFLIASRYSPMHGDEDVGFDEVSSVWNSLFD